MVCASGWLAVMQAQHGRGTMEAEAQGAQRAWATAPGVPPSSPANPSKLLYPTACSTCTCCCSSSTCMADMSCFDSQGGDVMTHFLQHPRQLLQLRLLAEHSPGGDHCGCP